MNAPHQTVSPLRQRMIEDMRMRRLSPKTQTAYIRAVRRLAAYLGRPPDTSSGENLRNFQLHLVDQGISPITLNATITGLKFFCEVTLERAELMARPGTCTSHPAYCAQPERLVRVDRSWGPAARSDTFARRHDAQNPGRFGHEGACAEIGHTLVERLHHGALVQRCGAESGRVRLG